MTDRSAPHPGVISPEEIRPWFEALGPLARRMWPTTFSGLEHVPEDDDRILVVANHSAMGTAELFTLALAWYERFGTTRPVAGMAHPAAFKVPPLRSVLHALGAVEATREGAAIARRARVPILLFPGGDHEASRPMWQPKVVDFAGRTGWVRLAREHGLSIVPLCITGSHATLPIVARGKLVAWLTGLRLLGAHRGPLPLLGLATGALAWHLARDWSLPARAAVSWAAMFPTIMLPWVPSRIGFHFLPRVDADDVARAGDREVHDRVVAALQRRLEAEPEPARADEHLQSEKVDASSRPW